MQIFSDPQYCVLNKYVLVLSSLQSIKGTPRILDFGDIINV